MKKIMLAILCIVHGNGIIAGAADVQVFQPDAMTVNVINKNKPTIVNQNNPTINIGKDDPFNTSNPRELKFRMQCLSQEQLQEKLVSIDEQQLKFYLKLLSGYESQDLLNTLGSRGQNYVTKKRGSRAFLNIIEDNIAQEKKREEERLVFEKKNEAWKKKGQLGFVGIFVMCIGAIAGGTIYG